MIGVLGEGWDFFLRVVDTAPPGVWAALAGTLASWGVTQRVKFLLPVTIRATIRKLYSQAFAFVIGFVVTLALWPTTGGAALALLVGLLSPFSFWLFMRLIGKRWPDIRDRLSQDVRA